MFVEDLDADDLVEQQQEHDDEVEDLEQQQDPELRQQVELQVSAMMPGTCSRDRGDPKG